MVEIKEIAVLGLVAVLAIEGRKILQTFVPGQQSNGSPINILVPGSAVDPNELAKTISDASLATSKYAFDFVAGYAGNIAQSGIDAVTETTQAGYDAISDFYSDRYSDAQSDISEMRSWMSDTWSRMTADRSGGLTVEDVEGVLDRYTRAIDSGSPRAPLVDPPASVRYVDNVPVIGQTEKIFDYVYNPNETIVDRIISESSSRKATSRSSRTYDKTRKGNTTDNIRRYTDKVTATDIFNRNR